MTALLALLLAAAPAQALPPPAPPAAVDIPLPPLATATLDNGLKVIAFERHEQPVFIAQLAVPAGTLAEPVGKAGLADFTAGVLTKGTRTRTADAIIDWLDDHGAELAATAGPDYTAVSAQGLSRDLDELLGLMAESVIEPSFPKAEVERLRPQLEAKVRSDHDDPAELAEEHLDYLLYGYGHPFGRPDTLATVAAIDLPAIVAFHQAQYRPNGSVLVLTGDFDARKLLDKVRAAFGPWQTKGVPPLPAPPTLSRPRVRVVNKPDATQTQIRLAFLMPPRGNPNHFPITLMNAVLGSGFGSRLMATLRVKEGKTYGIHTSVNETATVGELNLSTFTRNAEVGDTLKKTLALIEAYKEEGPSEDELARVRGLVGGGFVVSISDPRALAGALLEQELYGLGDGYVRSFRRKVQAVSVADARAAAARYLLPPGFALVLVGNAKDVLLQVRGLFPGVQVELRQAAEPIADEERPGPQTRH